MEHLQELEAMGVTSLKIEGRMKRAEYVAAVTAVYAQAAKTARVTHQMMDTLHTAFNRQGFTQGYYEGRTGQGMFGVRQEEQETKTWCKQMRQSYEASEAPLVPVTFSALIRPEGCRISVTDPEGRVCSLDGPIPEPHTT